MRKHSTPIPVNLGNGISVVIDIADFDRVLARRWNISRAHGRPDYVVTSFWDSATQKRGNLYLHRFIMNATAGTIIDHIDGDTFNNSRSNLRFATHQQNMANSKRRTVNTSGYKGVQRRCDGKKWVARIQVHKKSVHLGSFDSPEAAARAYDEAAILHFGEFARLNFPD